MNYGMKGRWVVIITFLGAMITYEDKFHELCWEFSGTKLDSNTKCGAEEMRTKSMKWWMRNLVISDKEWYVINVVIGHAYITLESWGNVVVEEKSPHNEMHALVHIHCVLLRVVERMLIKNVVGCRKLLHWWGKYFCALLLWRNHIGRVFISW